MPPKKRHRPAAPVSTPPPPTPSAPPATTTAAEPILFDGWTDEQETTLFKAISVYRLKPAGIHKHFRVVGIAELMKNHGVSDVHTNIPGIWRKLSELYNLEGLDEREMEKADAEETATPGASGWEEFALPPAEFGEMMMDRRMDGGTRDSPAVTHIEDSESTDNGSLFLLIWSGMKLMRC
jgi:MRG-binding protein